MTACTDNENQKVEQENIIIHGVSNIINIPKFSNLQKLIRVTFYVLRFLKVCKSFIENNRQERKSYVKQPQLDEINEATMVWIKDVQQTNLKER